MPNITTNDLKTILTNCRRALDDGAQPIAAFDADGTLWDTDLGENFFRHQVDQKLVPLPEDPWQHYQQWHDTAPIEAYYWLAQINKGQNISTVRQWAKDALGRYPGSPPIFGHMVDLVEGLQSLGVHIYIVTASVKWAVEPAAHLVGLSAADVIGIETAVDFDGTVTDEPVGFVTWREGKVTAMHKTCGGRPYFFAAGNSTGDTFMLRAATHVALAQSFARPHWAVFESEQKLLSEAREKDWFTLSR
jgi:HAD superfamily phosphoserine phosphatase-like hydrolase